MKDWPTRKLVGVGSVLALMTVAGTLLLLRVAWSAWQQGSTGVALGAFAAAILFGSWVVVIWEMGTALLHRWRSRNDDERTLARGEINFAATKSISEKKPL